MKMCSLKRHLLNYQQFEELSKKLNLYLEPLFPTDQLIGATPRKPRNYNDRSTKLMEKGFG
ncbi:hypothetical protein MA16_Dca025117 [Dendrobium catenatum]|uniref:Uncharacterized protein n=1 Tax=Dendrobium catenatum TaxID=906689 RepID=A0A2I0WKZ7_9ASPA|nr:hypothetical protein MA16_Dca025117 [Dendrobium catenatum]